MTTDATTRKKVLLTGGNGALGYNVLTLLAEDVRYEVTAPVRDISATAIRALADRVHFVEHDLSDAMHTAQIFERVNPDVVVHCAASGLRPPRGPWFDLMQFNVACTMGLFQMNCRLDHPSHFIYVSTGLVYREQQRPLNEDDPIGTLHPYGASKAAADLMLQAAAAEFGRRLTILRPFAFTGTHDCGNRLFPLILRAAVEGRRQVLTAGSQVRDFCSVNDIAAAVTKVMAREQAALIEQFNLGSGRCLPLRGVIEEVCGELELKADLAFGEGQAHRYEPGFSVANVTRAENELGWKARTGVSYAVWELAQELAPMLRSRRPERSHGTV